MKRVKPAAQPLNFSPIGQRQPEQFRDHRQRQLARIALDEIGGAAFGKQLIGELVAERLDVRLHVEHGAAAKRLVDDVAQPLVVRLVHRQHAVGQRAHDARHPPLQSRDIAIVLANGEGRGVLQHLIGKRLRRRRPDFADDRENALPLPGPKVRSFSIAAAGLRK